MNPRRGVLRQYIVVQELSSVTLTQVTGIWKPTDSGYHSLLARDKAETTATNAVREGAMVDRQPATTLFISDFTISIHNSLGALKTLSLFPVMHEILPAELMATH